MTIFDEIVLTLSEGRDVHDVRLEHGFGVDTAVDRVVRRFCAAVGMPLALGTPYFGFVPQGWFLPGWQQLDGRCNGVDIRVYDKSAGFGPEEDIYVQYATYAGSTYRNDVMTRPDEIAERVDADVARSGTMLVLLNQAFVVPPRGRS